jgi:uncharacterized damage-inducible protein DinB
MSELLEENRNHHRLITDVLSGLTTEQLKQSVGKGMGTLGMQFRHIADIESCYIEALRSGTMDFGKQGGDRKIEGNKEKLLEYFERNQHAIVSALLNISGEASKRRIDWSKTHQKYGLISVDRHF